MFSFFKVSAPSMGLWKTAPLCILLGIFLTVVCSYIFGEAQKKEIEIRIDNLNESLKFSVEEEYEKLLSISTDVGRDQSVLNDIAERDILSLAATVNNYKENRGVKLMVVTDEDGIVLSRARFEGLRGDYFFDTRPQGKKIAEGETVKMILGVGEHLPLFIASGVPLLDRLGQLIGSVTVSSDFSEIFAQEYKAGNLLESEHIAFYAPEYGIVGSTFEEGQKEVIEHSFLGTARNIEKEVVILEPIVLDDVKYNVVHVSFVDLSDFQESTGGAFLFIPDDDSVVFYEIIGGIFLTLLFFSLMSLFFSRLRLNHIVDFLVLTVTVIISVSVTSIMLSLIKTEESAIDISNETYPIYNSTISLNPSGGIFDTNYDQRISVIIESGGELINAAKAVIQFDPEKIRVEDIVDFSTFCEPGFVIEREIDNENGFVSFSCGTRVPFSGRTATLVDLVVRPIMEGDFELIFAEETQVLAHDGLGTNVLRKKTSASYTVQESGNPDDLILFSLSHPNRTKWYSNAFAEFSWRGTEYENYQYTLSDTLLTEMAPKASVVNGRSVTLRLESEGTYYFYLQPQDQEGKLVGDLHEYKIKVDNTPPDVPKVRLSKYEVEPGELVRMEFESKDSSSGIETPYYYISYNGETFFPVQSPFYTAFPDVGIDIITIRAYDNAGNISETKVPIEVRGSKGKGFFGQSASAINALSVFMYEMNYK